MLLILKTDKDLADHLKHMGNQPKVYNEFRNHWYIYPTGRFPKDFLCHVCEKIISTKSARNRDL